MQDKLVESIINLIERNRISSTEVADALGKKGVLEHILPINSGMHFTGKVQYVYTFDESNWPLHEQIQTLEEDTILYVDTFNCDNKAIFGDLVSKYILLYKKTKAVVVNGLMRDIPDLIKENYAVWCTGYTPLGCYNKQVTAENELLEKMEDRRKIFDGGILTVDDSGCTLIRKDEISEEIYKRLELIELQEDIWFYCLDTLKWSTFETVCQKKYLQEPESLPEGLRSRLKEIPFKS